MISTIADIILLIALALILARLFGYLFDHFNQPVVIGEIIAGILLGGIGFLFINGQIIELFSYTITLPDLNYNSEIFHIFAEFGILFMLFISGLKTSIAKLKKMEKSASLTAIGGIILPLLLGVIVGLIFHFNLQESLIIGMILVATSVGVTVRSLFDLHVLDSDIGATILGAAVIDDIIGIIILAFFLGVESPIFISIKIAIFFIIFLYLGLKIMDHILQLGERIHLPKALLSISLAIFLLYSFFASQFGIANIIGAFIAGLIIGNVVKNRRIIDDVQTIGYSFFIPLFFIWIGARLWIDTPSDNNSYSGIALLAFSIIFVAIIGKILGCGFGARLGGLSRRESLEVGIGMIPRLELALIIASTAIASGLFSSIEHEHQILVSTVLLTIVTTVITPLLIKKISK